MGIQNKQWYLFERLPRPLHTPRHCRKRSCSCPTSSLRLSASEYTLTAVGSGLTGPRLQCRVGGQADRGSELPLRPGQPSQALRTRLTWLSLMLRIQEGLFSSSICGTLSSIYEERQEGRSSAWMGMQAVSMCRLPTQAEDEREDSTRRRLRGRHMRASRKPLTQV